MMNNRDGSEDGMWLGLIAATAIYVLAAAYGLGGMAPPTADQIKASAPILQAVLSAGAIYSAWWLQSRKREADRRDTERDTLRTLKAVTGLLEGDLADMISLAKAKPLLAQPAGSLADQLKESDAIVRRQNLGHLPSEAATRAVLTMMRTGLRFAGVLKAIAAGDMKLHGNENEINIFASNYKKFYDERTVFLKECGFEPEAKRHSPDKIRAFTAPKPKALSARKPRAPKKS